jgi:hypothetical protein
MRFVLDKAALVQVLLDYFCFPCQSFGIIIHHQGLVQKAN